MGYIQYIFIQCKLEISKIKWYYGLSRKVVCEEALKFKKEACNCSEKSIYGIILLGKIKRMSGLGLKQVMRVRLS